MNIEGEILIQEIFKKEIMPNSIVSVIYDTYSSAWLISFALLKNEVDKGGFGIISNYNLPLPNLFRAAEFVGLDLSAELERGNAAIIDVFGSKYGSRFNLKNVFYLNYVDPETINPKIDMIYENRIKPLLGDRKAFRVVYTLDGAALMLGEHMTLKLLNQTIAVKTKLMPNSVLVLPLNKDVVSQRFVAWITSISEYVIVASSKIGDEGLEERLHLVKSPLEEFAPSTYTMWTTKGKKAERLRVKKLTPEFGPLGKQ
ncbi:hypothetical protein [Thermococcus barophilus]|uniref:KaiC-like domain-containing protein n=1 Tax=Thermococcus barophilus (strain DSM 11836 / MP) TaxID=391623 RepID=F0LJK2_THEBM|nr:hypothetical protein [Thermococcus barophilus]ADT83468.1 hypothetical protein TERMP_00491 [Thermococcus barophilus MP]